GASRSVTASRRCSTLTHTRTGAASSTRTGTSIARPLRFAGDPMITVEHCSLRTALRLAAAVALALLACVPIHARADTVASLLGNFTVNQYSGLELRADDIGVHHVIVFGQLPALRELHLADADGDGVTTQAERDAYAGRLAETIAEDINLTVDDVRV